MVPCCAKLGAEKSVGPALARCKGALCDTIGAIHRIRLPLTQTVPVHAGTIDLQSVSYRDLECITPACTNCRSRILAVNRHHQALDAVRSHVGGVCHFKRVFDSFPRIGPIGIVVSGNGVSPSPASSAEGAIGTRRVPWHYLIVIHVDKLRTGKVFVKLGMVGDMSSERNSCTKQRKE